MKLHSFDIETWGAYPGYALQPWRVYAKQAGIMMMAFDTNTCFKNLANDTILCGWNLKFDLAFLYASGFEEHISRFKYLDGMLLLKRLYPDLPTYALKPSLERFKDELDCDYVSGYSDGIVFKTGTSDNYTAEELTKMREYNKRDAVYTLALTKYLIEQVSPNMLIQAIRESTVSYLFAKAWATGILIDENEVDRQSEKVQKTLQYLADNLYNKCGLTKSMMASPAQLRDFFIQNGINLTELTEKGQLSVNSTVLKNLYYSLEGGKKKLLKAILMYRELETEAHKFINGARECMETVTEDRMHIIHPEPILQGTYTGRLTYSVYQNIKEKKQYKNGKVKEHTKKIRVGLPIHQMKRGELRNIFIAPDKYKILELDFSGQEMRLMAAISKDPTMVRLFNENKDLHAYTAASIAGMDYEEFQALKSSDPKRYKDMRYIGKLTNLSLQYRLSAPMLYRQWHDKYGLIDKTQGDALKARETYLKIYHGIPDYWERSIHFAKQNRFVMNVCGRKCILNKWNRVDAYSSEQTAINFPIQSTGAEQKILALYSLREFLTKHKIEFKWDLHDGMYFYVPDSDWIKEIVDEMVEMLSDLPYKRTWDWEPVVKFPVEAKIGNRWGELKSI